MELDHLDQIAADAFDGYIVRKDLVRKFARQYPVPTYVCEFLLGRYCASVNEEEIQEGLQIVERQLRDRAVRSGEEELFKARARETGSVKIIDIISARLDAKTDSYLATLPSLQLKDVQHREQARQRERADADGRLLRRGRPGLRRRRSPRRRTAGRSRSPRCGRSSSRSGTFWTPSTRGGRGSRPAEWKHFLLRSIGLEPTSLTERQIDVLILRMVPFVENNYNLVELGPRGTGKSHLFQQISPYAHLVSGGKATVARMFVNMANGQRGLVCQYDVVCFDEVSGVSFDQKDGVNIMKGYMESGEFSRGKESIRAYGSIVMVGNFDVDVQHQQRIGHLFGPMPPEMRNDTALMDRIHCYLPGWDVPKISEALKTDHFGLVSDFLSECWSRLRSHSRVVGPAGPGDLRRCPERPRPERRQQDGQRAAEADPPVARRSSSPTRTWNGPSGWRWSAAAGSRSSRSGSSRPSSATRSSATRWARTGSRSSWSRPNSRARTTSAATRCRPARSGASAPAVRTRARGSTGSR